MSKIKSLIKKIEVFEKLAVYSDQASFLKKISQTSPSQALDAFGRITAQVRTIVEHFRFAAVRTYSQPLNGFISSFEQYLTSGMDANNAQAAYNLISKAEQQLAADGRFKTLLQQIRPSVEQMHADLFRLGEARQQAMQDMGPAKELTPIDVYDLPGGTGRPRQVNIKDLPNVPKKANLPDGLQASLNQLGYPVPLVQDNVLGPETQKALDWFKGKKGWHTSSGAPLYTAIMSASKAERLNSPVNDLADAVKQQEQQARFPSPIKT